MGEVIIPYKPRKWSVLFHNSLERWQVLVLHRRAGKTTAMINHLQRSALDDDLEHRRLKYLAPQLSDKDIGTLLRARYYGLIFPTYTQAKTVAWEMLKYYAQNIPRVIKNESELSIKYPNGSTLRLFGSDNVDSLRGIAFWGLGFDEYSQQPPNIFSEVLSKSLADHLGYAIFGGTIKGKNQLFRTYEAFKNDPKAFTLWQDIDKSLATEEGATITLLKQAIKDDEELVRKGLMTQEEFDQEWYLSPTAAVKGAVYASEISEAMRDGRIGIVPYDKVLKVYTIWDRGVGANLVVGFFQRAFGQLRLIDVWQGQNHDGLPQAIKVLQNKPYIYGRHFGPHDIEATDASTGKTWAETASGLGVKFDVVPDIGVIEGIHAGRMAFSRLWIDEKKCQLFIDAISAYHYEYDSKRGMFKELPYHDFASHFGDMWRYAAIIEESFTNENEETVGRWEETKFDIY